MNFGIALLIFGGFLLGGAWSVWRIEPDTTGRAAPHAKGRAAPPVKGRAAPPAKGRRAAPQILLVAVLLASALLATASGILRLI